MNWSSTRQLVSGGAGPNLCGVSPQSGKVTLQLEPGRYKAEWFRSQDWRGNPDRHGGWSGMDIAGAAGPERLGIARSKRG